MAGPINWISQIASVTKFGLLGIPQRRGSVAAAVFGIAGVVAVLVGVLSIAAGFRQVMAASGAPDAAIVLRSGADSEMVSGLAAQHAHHRGCAGRGPHARRGRWRRRSCLSSSTCPRSSTGTRRERAVARASSPRRSRCATT